MKSSTKSKLLFSGWILFTFFSVYALKASSVLGLWIASLGGMCFAAFVYQNYYEDDPSNCVEQKTEPK